MPKTKGKMDFGIMDVGVYRFVWKVNGIAAAGCLMNEVGSERILVISEMYVHTEHRNKGICKAMNRFMMKKYGWPGSVFICQTNNDNATMRHILNCLGWHTIHVGNRMETWMWIKG